MIALSIAIAALMAITFALSKKQSGRQETRPRVPENKAVQTREPMQKPVVRQTHEITPTPVQKKPESLQIAKGKLREPRGRTLYLER